jgi:alpha-tubulin suppressor-like RCC1 family protein
VLGENRHGELGNGAITQTGCGCSTTPVDVSGLSTDGKAVGAGWVHTCALTAAGAVKCWGSDYRGELGDGSQIGSSTPVDVSGLTSGVAAISAGFQHTCAVTVAGGIKCWGFNRWGQLGNGTTTTTGCSCISTPVDVNGLAAEGAAVSANADHTCDLTTAGAVKCWGLNSRGELGNGTTTDSTTPVDVSGLTSGVVALSDGSGPRCALTSSGEVKCWGFNGDGELGIGIATRSGCSCLLTPVTVAWQAKPPTGDVNCDAAVSAIDAALLLQYDAFISASLACPQNADVSQDHMITAVDATLILQFSAGLLQSLPS